MEFKAPECNYCRQMYSRFNEPILIVCLCDKVAKYAHGSCFRDYLYDCSYGVCDTCFTKTRLVPDGYKSMANWKVKWKPICGFWRRFKTDNRYWKVVYCREEISNDTKGKKTIRYEDVPLEIPWKNEPVPEEDPEETIQFEIPGIQENPVNKEPGSDIEETRERGFSLPVVFKPRGYPYVKRNVSDDHLSPTDSFDCYSTLSSNRGSFNSVNHRSIYGDSNSIYTVMTTGTNGSSSIGSSENSDNENEIDKQQQFGSKESKFRSIGRQFFKKFVSETGEEVVVGKIKSKRNSNNNTMRQVYTIDESKIQSEIAVLPLENDIIYMHDTKSSSMSKIQQGEDYWKMNNDKDDVMSTSTKSKQNGRKTKKQNKKSPTETSVASKQLFGVSPICKSVVENTPEPSEMRNNIKEKPLTGLIGRGDTSNVFYAP